ncbi:PTS IIA-like nitrogen regulatory protein PtsN [Methylonatrum kenyense]|nr:PTS IIA-like nitrogen regulatory protein PtsN [Methylonatrum kenyense]
MKIADLITPERVVCDADVSSKKRGLELLSELVAERDSELQSTAIFNKLISRERLGSTGLGHGVAIPHARIEGMPSACAAFIKLREGIDFDAFDQQPVDMLFSLVVPEHFTDEHLQILARLAEMFSDVAFCRQLRDCTDDTALHGLLVQWDSGTRGD